MKAHQRLIRESLLDKDLRVIGLPIEKVRSLTTKDFSLNREEFTPEITYFIIKYEWLKSIGRPPKYVFTARFDKFLSGVVLIANPYRSARLVQAPYQGDTYEALISRGACASWTPPNLASRLIAFSCKWMAQHTEKRIFCAYSDPEAGEIGTVYQACNFDYIGTFYGKKRIELFGKTCHSRAIYYASTWHKLCDKIGIYCDPAWFKNGRVRRLRVPKDIWAMVTFNLGGAVSTKTEAWKRKYCLVLGKNKTETKKLRAMRLYAPESYPKRENENDEKSGT